MSDTTVRCPDVHVQLTGEPGNASYIIGAVSKALRRAYVPNAEIERFRAEATTGDYDNVLQTAMRWVDVS